ncbi:MAG: GWxTD domain-containing protein [Candidatus Aminicenantaceae bacterium]
MKKKAHFLLLLFCLILLVSCASYNIEKNLEPESKEFLSKVRFIITKQERKIFLNLIPSERKAFIEEFWKKRDPDPDTEENEFKEEYFERIEMANKLFRGGGTPGWLQDRGRIYILLGPPHERIPYPRGRSFYGLPEEIWYYGMYPIVFIDDDWDGDYDLEPLSARYISEINRAQMDLKPKIKPKEVVFDFSIKIQKTKEDKVLIQIAVPYRNIWLSEEENILKTTLDLSLEISDTSDKKVWKHQKDYIITLSEEGLKDVTGKDYEIEIPAKLTPGNYTLSAELENETDKSRVRKNVKFAL